MPDAKDRSKEMEKIVGKRREVAEGGNNLRFGRTSNSWTIIFWHNKMVQTNPFLTKMLPKMKSSVCRMAVNAVSRLWYCVLMVLCFVMNRSIAPAVTNRLMSL